LIKTKDIVQELGYGLVYADIDSVFIKRRDPAAAALQKQQAIMNKF
jgi:hypothetical protein